MIVTSLDVEPDELERHGLEIVTVALDVDPEAAFRFIDRAALEHPSLIDSAHVVDELLGVVNVPNGVWIDEQGVLVRPAEPASPGRNPALDIKQIGAEHYYPPLDLAPGAD